MDFQKLVLSVFWCFLVSCFSSKCFRRCNSGVPKVPGWGPKESQGAVLVDHTEWLRALIASIFDSSGNLVTFLLKFALKIDNCQRFIEKHSKRDVSHPLKKMENHWKTMSSEGFSRIHFFAVLTLPGNFFSAKSIQLSSFGGTKVPGGCPKASPGTSWEIIGDD